MKKIFLSLILSSIGFCIAYTQDVRKLSELSLQGSMIYYNGTPYTGEAVDFDGKFDKDKLKFHGRYVNGKPSGHIRKWYPNHKLEYEENYGINGVKDGLQAYYYENGKVKEKSFYKNGMRDGLQEQWFDDGIKYLEMMYAAGVPNGKWITYGRAGDTVSVEIFQNGKTASAINYISGKKISEKYYSNGVPSGKWVWFDSTGNISAETEYESGKVAREVLYRKGNKSYEKFYSNGMPSGKWSEFDENNQLTSETIYSNGKINSQKSYKNNIPNGVWKTRDGDRLKQVVYKNGAAVSESNYLNDIPDGKQSEYIDSTKTKEITYKHGQKISEGVLLNNKEDGKWTYWSDNGSTMTVKIFENGQLIKEEEPIIIQYLVSNFHPSNNSFLLKIEDYEKPFIRIDLRNSNQQNSANIKKISELIRNIFSSPSKRLSKVFPDGPFKDESINYVIEVNNIDLRFDNCIFYQNNVKRYGYVTTIDVSILIRSTDGKITNTKTLSFQPRLLLLVTCSTTQELAFETAYAVVEKDFIKMIIDKNFPAKKR